MSSMGDVKPRRLDYVEQTRADLLDAAEALFCAQGYHATSLDAVAAAARFTKGAVYRHFADKQALFIAVLERVEVATMAALPQPQSGDDPWPTALAALAQFLDACAAPRYRRIVLEEGPSVLGWQRWRELDRQFTGQALRDLIAGLLDGEVGDEDVDRLAQLCCAVVGEAVLLIAQSDDPAATRAWSLAVLSRMFGGVMAGIPLDQ